MSIPSTHPAIVEAIRKGLVTETRPVQSAPKARKYRNEPTVVDGVRYDSKKEARHGQLLLALERDGLISELRRQVRYPLVVNGVRVCEYRADFVYFDRAKGAVSVVDVKGYRTAEYRIKKALMLAVHGIAIVEV